MVVACFQFQTRAALVDYRISNGGLETFNVTWDGNTENALAGGILLSKTAGPAAMPASFISVCTDIGGTLFLGNTYTYSAPTAFGNQDGIRPIWGAGNGGVLGANYMVNASAAIQAAADIFYKHNGVLTAGSTTQKAALQLAVWEALLDSTSGANTLNLGGGRFSVNSVSWDDDAAIALAATWVTQVNLTAQYEGYLLIPTPESQFGLAAQEVFYNVTPVPEAKTVVAGALLLLPLGASVIRIVRRSRLA
jgi:hypothetical protein